MNTLYKTAVMALTAMIMVAACGSTGAKNDDKKQKESQTAATKAGVKELTASDFNTMVYDTSKETLQYLGNKPAIVDFTATWCGPCQRIAPILEELAKEYDGDIVIYKVDIDKNQELAQAFGVRSIPAILYIPLDNEPSMTVGSRDKTRFKNEIETILLGK